MIGLDGGITHLFVNKAPKPLARMLFRKFKMAKNYEFEEYFAKVRRVKLIHHELTYGIPFPDDSVANVYSSHFFEHLFKTEAEFLLQECFRVLKNHGIIRVCVPSLSEHVASLKKAINDYETGENMRKEEIQKYVT
jgi:predicted SAM-dependent methyltransferase